MKHEPAAFKADELRFTHSDGLVTKEVFVHDGRRGSIERHTAVREPDALSRLRSRGTITHRQWQAAEDWQTDYERAGIGVVVVSSYSHGVRGDVEAEPERRRAAKERFRRGYDAMTNPSVVWAVVVEGMALSAWEHRHRVRHGTGSDIIRDSLDKLAEFYGIPRVQGT